MFPSIPLMDFLTLNFRDFSRVIYFDIRILKKKSCPLRPLPLRMECVSLSLCFFTHPQAISVFFLFFYPFWPYFFVSCFFLLFPPLDRLAIST